MSLRSKKTQKLKISVYTVNYLLNSKIEKYSDNRAVYKNNI